MATPLAPDRNAKASDHLANERTFLAWVRTSISIIVFGFVVAKFGITLREFLRMRGTAEHESGVSVVIGIGFMTMGIGMAIVSSIRYRRTMQQLEADQFEPAGASVTILAAAAALFGMILVGYLIYAARAL